MPITAVDLQEMITHWLGCRPNGYLGSDYGAGVHDLLHTPLRAGGADALIAKLRNDIAVMAQLSPETLEIYAEEVPPDRLNLYFNVAGAYVQLDVTPFARQVALIPVSAPAPAPAPVGDPYYPSVLAIVRADGANNSTSIIDSGPLSIGIAAYGGAKISTASPFGGVGSLVFDGAGDYVQSAIYTPTPTTGGLAGPFCQECWFWVDDIGVTRGIMSFSENDTSDFYWYVYRKGVSNKLCLFMGGSTQGFDRIIGADSVIAGQWNHAAHTRDGVSQKLWLNGVLQGEYSGNNGGRQDWGHNVSLKRFMLGSYQGASEFLLGKIDDYRLTFSQARYTAPFTPPTSLLGA